MTDDFPRVMEALWSSLRLGPFRAGRDGRARMDVEGRGIALEATPDGGSVLVSTTAGTVSADAVEASDQLRRLLRLSCGLVLVRAAALRLDAGAGGADTVDAQALAPCRVAAVPQITRAVEEALFLVEAAEPILRSGRGATSGRPSPASVPLASAPLDLADAMIFRP